MRNIIICLMLLMTSFVKAQQVLDPYIDYSQTNPYPDWPINNLTSYFQYSFYTPHANPGYDGEYEIDIHSMLHEWDVLFPGLLKTYNIEAVSFPFTMPCAFLANGCSGNIDRQLSMPIDQYNNQNAWGYLSREMAFPGDLLTATTHQTLVSNAFVHGLYIPPEPGRSLLPHTILKHTINIYCVQGGSPLSSFSWYTDLTRGIMRNYPFTNTNSGGSPSAWDIIYFPDIVNDPYNSTYGNTFSDYIENYPTINYFPYSDIPLFTGCSIAGTGHPSTSDYYGNYIYPNSYALVSAPPRGLKGHFLAGYNFNNVVPNAAVVTKMNGMIQHYTINKGYPDLDLRWINPSERTIYNPSEVTVKSDNTSVIIVRFPAGYVFKTILGVYPSTYEVADANTIANGGPYTDLRKVPVPVNAKDLKPPPANPDNYPEVSWNDPTTGIDDRFGYYYIENLGQIYVENCVKIFDAIFEARPGGTLWFQSYPSIKNPARFTTSTLGGAVLKNYANIQYVENGIITQNYPLLYKATDKIISGRDVDPAPSVIGDYTVEPTGNVTFTATNEVRLKNGFRAKNGSFFRANCALITYSDPCLTLSAMREQDELSKSTSSIGKNYFHIQPNPGTGIFEARIDNFNSACEFKITDVYGRIVMEEKSANGNLQFDISNQPTGIYIVTANVGSQLWTGRVIKN